jgi:hypothetical protein
MDDFVIGGAVTHTDWMHQDVMTSWVRRGAPGGAKAGGQVRGGGHHQALLAHHQRGRPHVSEPRRPARREARRG